MFELILKRHENALSILKNNTIEQIFSQAMKNDGCEFNVVSFYYGYKGIDFRPNGDIVLTLRGVSVSSFFGSENSDEELEEVNIRISDSKIDLLC